MFTSGIMQAARGMKKNRSAAAVDIIMASVGSMFKIPVTLMDREKNADNMNPLHVIEVMINESQEKFLLKIQRVENASPEGPGN